MTEDIKGGSSDCLLSKTYSIKVGCGHLYITVCYDQDKRFKRLFIPRNSKFHCDLIVRDGLSKLVTFEGRRNLKQIIRDLRGDKFGHHCSRYNINAQAASCFDAVSKSLELWKKSKRKRKGETLTKSANSAKEKPAPYVTTT